MKKIILLLITFFCMCHLVACGGEAKEDASAGGSNEVVDNSTDDEPVVTAEPTVEVTPAPTEEPTTEATPAPTEEPTPAPTENPYPGIDMESDLPGLEWIETFVGIIDEPKVVVYSDVTGKKQIVEMGDKVFVNPDEDMIAIYVPDGCNIVNKKVDIYTISGVRGEHCEAYVLDAEKTKEKSFWKSAFCVKYDESEEEIFYKFTLKPQ